MKGVPGEVLGSLALTRLSVLRRLKQITSNGAGLRVGAFHSEPLKVDAQKRTQVRFNLQ